MRIIRTAVKSLITPAQYLKLKQESLRLTVKADSTVKPLTKPKVPEQLSKTKNIQLIDTKSQSMVNINESMNEDKSYSQS